jgi:translocation and assembly module TamB
MRLRFPEGMRSVVDATLTLQGPASGPTLTGTVTVDNATWTRGFDASGNVFGLGASDDIGLPVAPGAISSSGLPPLRYDVRIVAPSTLHVENEMARIVASSDLSLRGTFERPLLFGRAEIERGEVRFEGRRYQVTRGSLDFTNPNRIQPFFDVEAETRVRMLQQTYLVTLRMAGTTERMQPEFTSDPPLAPMDTPLLIDPTQDAASRLDVNPAARVTIGKRISDRVYLTYARSLSSSTRDELILLEYDQNDSLGWVLSQNEDRTYALEVRKRHLF